MITKLRPLTGKVLLLMDKPKEVKAGPIIFTEETSKQLYTYASGIVVAVGDTAFNYAPDSRELCKAGDRVYIIKNAGVVLAENAGYTSNPDAPKHRIVNDEDILCVEVKEDE